jgi:hypothetical protein
MVKVSAARHAVSSARPHLLSPVRGAAAARDTGPGRRPGPRPPALLVVIELRVRPKPPPPSLATDRGTRSTGASAARAHAARVCGSIRINYRPTPSEHYRRMYIGAPRSVACATALRVMRRYRDDRGPCAGVWGVILLLARRRLDSQTWDTLRLVCSGWWMGWTSATIARVGYPPPNPLPPAIEKSSASSRSFWSRSL